MKNLLFAISVLVFSSLVSADFDYTVQNETGDFPVLPEGLPFKMGDSGHFPKCTGSNPYMLRESKKYCKRDERYCGSTRSLTPVAFGGEYTITFTVKVLEHPYGGQTLFHTGNYAMKGYKDGEHHIDLSFPFMQRRVCEVEHEKEAINKTADDIKSISQYADEELSLGKETEDERESIKCPMQDFTGQLQFSVTPSEKLGGEQARSFISASYQHAIVVGEYMHVMAIHRESCPKTDSGLELWINGERSLETSPYLTMQRGYNYAHVAESEKYLRDVLYLGRPAQNKRFNNIDADIDCLSIYDRALSPNEIAAHVKSAFRCLRAAGALDETPLPDISAEREQF